MALFSLPNCYAIPQIYDNCTFVNVDSGDMLSGATVGECGSRFYSYIQTPNQWRHCWRVWLTILQLYSNSQPVAPLLGSVAHDFTVIFKLPTSGATVGECGSRFYSYIQTPNQWRHCWRVWLTTSQLYSNSPPVAPLTI